MWKSEKEERRSALGAGLKAKIKENRRITNPPEADCKYRTRNNECRRKGAHLD
jgi:hypothetical protein